MSPDPDFFASPSSDVSSPRAGLESSGTALAGESSPAALLRLIPWLAPVVLCVSLTAVPGIAAAQRGAAADTVPADTVSPDAAERRPTAPGDTTAREPLRVFLDCPDWLCDFDYFREEIPYVTWVRDRQVADVHVLVTEQETRAGGQRITLDLLGRGRFDGLERRATYAAPPSQADAGTGPGGAPRRPSSPR